MGYLPKVSCSKRLHRSQARLLRLMGVLLVVVSLATSGATPPGNIAVDRSRGGISADVSQWPLDKVLSELARSTRWQVFADTNTQVTVSTRFDVLPYAESLPRLLGGMNFTLLPQTNSPTRLYVFRSSARDAVHRIPPAPDSAHLPTNALGDELVVRLRPGAHETIDALAARVGARVVGRLDDLHAYRLKFEDSDSALRARTALEAMDDVGSVELNYATPPPPRVEPLGVSTMPPLGVRPKSVPGADQVVVALLDTAVSAGNPALKDFLLPSTSVAGNTQVSPGELTHGTAMAEILLRSLASQTPGGGESPVRILPVDVYGNQEMTSTFDIVRGLLAAAAQGPDAINLSLGGAGDSPLLHETIQSLRDQGILMFAAPGNEPTTSPTYPAAYAEVMAVTASDRQGQLADYANRGSFVDLIAPGTGIAHAENQSYLVTGTSASTARMTGIAAALLSRKGASPADVLSTLRQTYAFQPPSSTADAPR